MNNFNKSLIINIVLSNLGIIIVVLFSFLTKSFFLICIYALLFLGRFIAKTNIYVFDIQENGIKITNFLPFLVFNKKVDYSNITKFTYELHGIVRRQHSLTFHYYHNKTNKKALLTPLKKDKLINLLNFLKDKIDIDNESFEKLNIILDNGKYKFRPPVYNYNKY